MARISKLTPEEREERIRKRAREKHQRNKEKDNARSRAYYRAHPEKFREYAKHHPDRRRAYARDYYKRNREKLLKRQNDWRRAHPERVAEWNRRQSIKRAEETRAKRIARELDGARNGIDTEKAAAMFKNPIAAAHYRWIVQRKQSEIDNKAKGK